MLAVLGDAVDCYRRGRLARDPATRLLFDETRAWLESTDRRATFSFESICDALDIDADYLRRCLRTACARPGPRRHGVGSAARRGGSSPASRHCPRAPRNGAGKRARRAYAIQAVVADAERDAGARPGKEEP